MQKKSKPNLPLEQRTKRANEPLDTTEFLITADLVAHFGVSPGTIYEWIKNGWLQATNIWGGKKIARYLFHVDAVKYFDEWLTEHRSEMIRYVPRHLHRKHK